MGIFCSSSRLTKARVRAAPLSFEFFRNVVRCISVLCGRLIGAGIAVCARFRGTGDVGLGKAGRVLGLGTGLTGGMGAALLGRAGSGRGAGRGGRGGWSDIELAVSPKPVKLKTCRSEGSRDRGPLVRS